MRFSTFSYVFYNPEHCVFHPETFRDKWSPKMFDAPWPAVATSMLVVFRLELSAQLKAHPIIRKVCFEKFVFSMHSLSVSVFSRHAFNWDTDCYSRSVLQVSDFKIINTSLKVEEIETVQQRLSLSSFRIPEFSVPNQSRSQRYPRRRAVGQGSPACWSAFPVYAQAARENLDSHCMRVLYCLPHVVCLTRKPTSPTCNIR